MLEKKTTLTHFYLSGVFLQGCGIFQALQHNTTLVHLNFSCTCRILDDTALATLTTMLEKNKTLTHLDLSGNYSLECNIFQALQHNSSLVHLNLSNTRLVATEHTTRTLTTMLQVNKTLTHLDLSGNWRFFELHQTVYCLCEGFQHNTTLRHLKLADTGIKDSAKTQIRQAMNYNLTLDISVDQNSPGYQCNII